jgi:hypothetical protein
MSHLPVPVLVLAFASGAGVGAVSGALCSMLPPSPPPGRLVGRAAVLPSDTRMVIFGGGGGDGGGGGWAGAWDADGGKAGSDGAGAGVGAGATAAVNAAGAELAAATEAGAVAGVATVPCAASQGPAALPPEGAGTDGGWTAGRGEGGDELLGTTARKMRLQKLSPVLIAPEVAAALGDSAPLSRLDSTLMQPAASSVPRKSSGSMRIQLPLPARIAPGRALPPPPAMWPPRAGPGAAAIAAAAPRTLPPRPCTPRRWCAGIVVAQPVVAQAKKKTVPGKVKPRRERRQLSVRCALFEAVTHLTGDTRSAALFFCSQAAFELPGDTHGSGRVCAFSASPRPRDHIWEQFCAGFSRNAGSAT